MLNLNTKFAKAIAAFQAASEKHAKFGAADTEPRAIFAELLDDAITYGAAAVAVPATAAGWELYDIGVDFNEVNQAAFDLYNAAYAAVAHVNDDADSRALANAILGR